MSDYNDIVKLCNQYVKYIKSASLTDNKELKKKSTMAKVFLKTLDKRRSALKKLAKSI